MLGHKSFDLLRASIRFMHDSTFCYRKFDAREQPILLTFLDLLVLVMVVVGVEYDNKDPIPAVTASGLLRFAPGRETK